MKIDFTYYLSIFIRRLHYFILISGLLSVAGVSISTMLPDMYRATALVLVEEAQIPSDLATSTVRTNAAAQIGVIRQKLTARANILDIATDLNIYKNRSGLQPEAIVADMRRRILINYKRRGKTGTLQIAFSGPDPEQAARVANELVTIVLNENAERRTDQASQTLEFFQGESDRLSTELDQRGAAILEFKLANKEALPESLNYLRNQQNTLQERLLGLERRTAELEERKLRLTDLFERTGRVEFEEASLTPAQRQLRQAQSELNAALLIYSENHPSIRVLKARIGTLEATATEQQATAGPDGERELSIFEVQIADIDGQIDIAERQKTEVADGLQNVAQVIDSVPTNAVQLSEMQRDFNNIQQQYNTVASRMATAAMGERIETLQKGQRFSLLEQAVVPGRPYSPNRPLILGGSIGGGIALGLAVILLLELINSAIRRPVDITSKLSITPLATLPYIRTKRESFLRRFVIIFALVIVLAGIPAAIWAVHSFYLPLDLIIDQLIEVMGLNSLLNS